MSTRELSKNKLARSTCMHAFSGSLTETITLSFLLSHHSEGLAKKACHRSSMEPMSFAVLLPNLLPAGNYIANSITIHTINLHSKSCFIRDMLFTSCRAINVGVM